MILVAPKGPGHLVRSEFEKGGGVPCLLASTRTPPATPARPAWPGPTASAARGRASSRPPSRTSARPTCSASRPSSAAGCRALIKAGFETLIEAGYPPEMAYFECVHEVKLIVDLIYQGGLDYMRY